MVLPVRIAALTLMLLVNIITACPGRHAAFDVKHKRWYGVPNWNQEGQERGPWPKRWIGYLGKEKYYIPYCYENPDDFDSLNTFVRAAITKWSIATAYVSDVEFIPGHPTAQKNPCNQSLYPYSTIHIIDTTSWANPEISTYTGWLRKPARTPPGTYRLDFARLSEGHPELAQKDVMIMAHELGHVMGLMHEHQRPDAPSNIEFRCENMEGYDQILADITHQRGAYLYGDTIERVCSDVTTANRYGFPLADFIPDDLYDIMHIIGEGEYPKDEAPDLDSIMMYDSYWHSSTGNFQTGDDFPKGAVLVAHKPGAASPVADGDAIRIFQAGGKVAESFASWGPSAGDVKRVAQMYPKGV